MLFVGMPSPFKEVWCERHRERLDVPVIIGVGGSFDVLAGFIKRAPRWAQAAGLEWLWRLLMEPRKLWKRYFTTNMRIHLARGPGDRGAPPGPAPAHASTRMRVGKLLCNDLPAMAVVRGDHACFGHLSRQRCE